MKIVNTENSEHYTWGQGADGWHLLKSDELSVIEESIPPNGFEERHYHEVSQQFFYVLSGEAHMEINDEQLLLSLGSGCHVPANVPHQIMNKSTKTLRFLVISQPKSHGDRANA